MKFRFPFKSALRKAKQNLSFDKPDITLPVTPMESITFERGEDFMAVRRDIALKVQERRERELALAPFNETISYEGHCGICDRDVTYTCGWDIFRTLPDGRKEPAWRERLVCPCGLSHRLRAALHFMLDTAKMTDTSAVYLTEQLTPFYNLLRDYNKGLVGSEYLSDGTPRGALNAQGVRNEDVTRLSFADNTFDIVGSFEVMEHVPDYKAGFKEMCRVLKPGGHLVATFPFRADLMETLVRARVTEAGEIEHIEEPEYHGDPLSEQGVLCFYHYGWDILQTMRDAGFSQARCHFFWSWENGYLGGIMPQFHAVK